MTNPVPLSGLVAAFILGSLAAGASTPAGPTASEQSGGLATPAAEATNSSFSLRVSATLGGEPFSCLPNEAAVMTPTELMLFVHDVEWVAADGTRTPAPLATDASWQTERVALLDFAGEGAGCRDASAAQNEQLFFQGSPPASTVSMAFRIGVPFELNHADPTRHSGPLTVMQMHWGWRGGYKILRLEGQAAGADVLLHLGSTGCTGPMTAIEACEHCGQLEVVVPWSSAEALRLELLPLLDTSLLARHRCMGVDAEGMQNCSTAWRALGEPGSGVWTMGEPAAQERP